MAPCLSRSVHQNIRGLHALNLGGLMLQSGMYFLVGFVAVLLGAPAVTSFFQGTLRIIASGIGISLCQQGSPLGPILQKLSKGATIVGLMVIGGMSASMVALSTPLAMTIGETTFEMQSYLDQIFPSLLSLLYVFLMFGCLKKGMKATGILLMTIAIALFGAFFGFLA